VAKIQEVARRAGVSVGSVSRVINKHPTVSLPTRTRVELAIRQLGYVPNALARSLRSRRSHTLGLIIPDVTNPFFGELAKYIDHAAAAAGYSLILGNSDNSVEKERLYLHALATRRVDGLILVPANETRPAFNLSLPLVGVDREVAGRPFVASDHGAGARAATEHLVTLGHQIIGCIAGPPAIPAALERRQGYASVAEPLLRAIGLDPDAYLVIGVFDYETGCAAARRLLTEVTPRPTAIFASSDQQAIGAMRAAADLGIVVPRELSIIGFDNIPLAELVTPRLTTVAQPVSELGVASVEALLEVLAGARRRPRRRLLAASLRLRDSCAPPARAVYSAQVTSSGAPEKSRPSALASAIWGGRAT
jgi:LacI family transcriptional regulator